MKRDMKKKERIIYESPSMEVYNIAIESNLLQLSGEQTNDIKLGDYEFEEA